MIQSYRRIYPVWYYAGTIQEGFISFYQNGGQQPRWKWWIYDLSLWCGGVVGDFMRVCIPDNQKPPSYRRKNNSHVK